jgi:hypothetical protein
MERVRWSKKCFERDGMCLAWDNVAYDFKIDFRYELREWSEYVPLPTCIAKLVAEYDVRILKAYFLVERRETRKSREIKESTEESAQRPFEKIAEVQCFLDNVVPTTIFNLEFIWHWQLIVSRDLIASEDMSYKTCCKTSYNRTLFLCEYLLGEAFVPRIVIGKLSFNRNSTSHKRKSRVCAIGGFLARKVFPSVRVHEIRRVMNICDQQCSKNTIVAAIRDNVQLGELESRLSVSQILFLDKHGEEPEDKFFLCMFEQLERLGE